MPDEMTLHLEEYCYKSEAYPLCIFLLSTFYNAFLSSKAAELHCSLALPRKSSLILEVEADKYRS